MSGASNGTELGRAAQLSEQNIPEQLRYTEDHEWIERISETRIRIGITDYAQSKLGDVVFAQLPEVDAEVESGEPFGEVESPKSVSDLYAPLTGKVVEVNSILEGTPELVNSDPYGEGWMVLLEVTDQDDLESQLEDTLDAEQYAAVIAD